MDPKKLTGTETEKNLWAAFSGESQARNKYTYFAAVARKEGYHQIAALFEETADNEKQHAKLWFKHLTASVTRLPTSNPRPTAKTTNGPICMRALPEKRRKKAFLNWPLNSAVSVPSKKHTRNVSSSF